MTLPGLTRLQLRALSFIAGYFRRHGGPPSYTEIKDHLGVSSKGNITRIVDALVERGRLIRHGRTGRSIAIVNEFLPPFGLPASVHAKLFEYCERTGKDPAAILSDAVLLYIDDADGEFTMEGHAHA